MDEMIKRFRKAANLGEEFSDEDVLEISKDTYMRAFIELDIAFDAFFSCIKEELIKTKNWIKGIL